VKAAAVQACQAATMNELFNSKNFQQLSMKTYMSGNRPNTNKKSASTSGASKRLKMKSKVRKLPTV
jgi:hypothetical protein